MKLKLDEHTLNAYLNEAIRLELNELVKNPQPEPVAPQNGPQATQQTGVDETDINQVLNSKYKIAQFQTWFNMPREQGGMGGQLVVDGIIGPKTRGAWQQWLQSQDL